MADAAVPAVELAALVSVLRLGDAAYGVSVRDEIEARTGRSASVAAVYAALERLASRGWVESWMSDPLPERGGRARRHYGLTKAGAAALETELAGARRLWDGVEAHLGARAG